MKTLDVGPLAGTHLHTWVRKPDQEEFQPCECSAEPPPFAKDWTRGEAAAANGWDDWIAFSGERRDGKPE